MTARSSATRPQAAGKTGRPLLWQLERARIVREVARTLDADERIRAERAASSTLETEVNFGRGPRTATRRSPSISATPRSPSAARSTGSTRTDDPDGEVVVYDYKTGSAKGFSGLEDDPVLQGTKIQLAIYALAAEQAFPGRPVRADYWHTAQPAGKELRGFDDRRRGATGARGARHRRGRASPPGTFPAYSGQGEPVLQLVRRVRVLRLRPPLLTRPRARLRREAQRTRRSSSSSSLRDLLEDEA